MLYIYSSTITSSCSWTVSPKLLTVNLKEPSRQISESDGWKIYPHFFEIQHSPAIFEQNFICITYKSRPKTYNFTDVIISIELCNKTIKRNTHVTVHCLKRLLCFISESCLSACNSEQIYPQKVHCSSYLTVQYSFLEIVIWQRYCKRLAFTLFWITFAGEIMHSQLCLVIPHGRT
jgi:hypothetical protein